MSANEQRRGLTSPDDGSRMPPRGRPKGRFLRPRRLTGAAGAERVILRRRSAGGLNGDKTVIRILDALGVRHMAAHRRGPGEPNNLLMAVLQALAQDPRMGRCSSGTAAAAMQNRPGKRALPKAAVRARGSEQAGSASHVTSTRQERSSGLLDPLVESRRSPKPREAIAPPTGWWKLAGS